MYEDKGWEVLSYILSKGAEDPEFDFTMKYNVVPAVAYGKKGTGRYGSRFGVQKPVKKYMNRLEKIMRTLGWEVVKWMGLTDDLKNVTGVEVEAPVLPGVGKINKGETIRAMDDVEKTKSGRPKLNTVKESHTKLFSPDWWNEEIQQYLLLEGGAYGHMNHPFDDKNLTFDDFRSIIDMGLQGNLDREENITEKTDGQNLMVTWKNGKLRAARNKGQLKDFGKSSLDAVSVARKFKGRGDIRNAFVYAMTDLGKSIKSLSDKQKKKIFNEGEKFMNLEIIYPASSNVINYDVAVLQFHGTLKYNKDGTSIGHSKEDARTLEGMIRQVNQHVQKHFKIVKPQFLTVPAHQDYSKKRDYFFGRLKKLQDTYMLTGSQTLSEYHQAFWEEYVYNAVKQFSYTISNKVLMGLVKRWAFFDKSYKINDIKKDIDNEKFLNWVLSFDKNDHAKYVKSNMLPFEKLFFELGSVILKNAEGFLAVSPKSTVQKIKKTLSSSIKTLQKGGDIKKLNKLKQELSKIQAMGGFDSIVPSEGLVFKYKGNYYKFTGAFAPINQITGMLTF